MRIDIIILLIHLLVITVIDYKKHIIPDQLVMSLVIFKLGYDLIINYSFVTMLTNIGYSLLITVPLLLLTVWMEKKTGKFQMGGGDIKLEFEYISIQALSFSIRILSFQKCLLTFHQVPGLLLSHICNYV